MKRIPVQVLALSWWTFIFLPEDSTDGGRRNAMQFVNCFGLSLFKYFFLVHSFRYFRYHYQPTVNAFHSHMTALATADCCFQIKHTINSGYQ